MGLFKKVFDKIEHRQQQQQQQQQPQYPQQQQQYQQFQPQQQYQEQYQPQQQQPTGPPPIPIRDYLENASSQPQQYQVSVQPSNYNNKQMTFEGDIFNSPIATDRPLGCFCDSNQHPVGLPQFYKQEKPIETNAFFGNLLVPEQTLPVWTHPYAIWQCKDPVFKGIAISHIEESQKVYGPEPDSNPARFFFNPAGIVSLMLSANEFESQQYQFRVGECERFSAGIRFDINNGGSLRSKFIQGMGFITGIYEGNITPRIASKIGIMKLDKIGKINNGLNKFIVTLNDNRKWVVYSQVEDFNQVDPNSYVAGSQAGSSVIVQIAKLPPNSNDNCYDDVAGCYPIDMKISSSIDESSNSAQYSFNYITEGSSSSGKTVIWSLPHQYKSFDDETKKSDMNLQLDATVSGVMRAICTNKLTMRETLPDKSLAFEPWNENGGFKGYSQNALNLIRDVCNREINGFDVCNASNTDSMYTAGKIVDKGAYLLYTAAFVINDDNLAKIQLEKMKNAMARFIENKQQCPLIYDTNWKGLVSNAGLDGNFYKDFGNTFYNDHHFHYGYHVHAASIITLVETKYGSNQWFNDNRKWVEDLIRDVSNPSDQDPYFPVFRSYDWYHGHSWANGLFGSGDGKDEESSSEDYNYAYSLRCWGMATGNKQLENIGSLMLSVSRRSMNEYMLISSDNTTQPERFKKNKVSGILFENKIDHTTYFGMKEEYIHGIHMIPITPASSFIRNNKFVKEEWYEKKLNEISNNIDDGWKGILMLNLAIIEPETSWNFFSASNFDDKWLDNGMSRTWALVYCAGLGGCH
ncbi:hydrolase activity, hydrolyzing O-glycosyl compounds protein [[Candida] boidinii]|nr:hydrolase activity, hydrolyzing O-glycosyl compounds protein [[Candida] boidinii]